MDGGFLVPKDICEAQCNAGVTKSKLNLLKMLLLGVLAGIYIAFGGFASQMISFGGLMKNWLFVYIGNLIGSLLFALTINGTNLLTTSSGKLGAVAVNTAITKVNIGFGPALLKGILCNIAVVLAVWMATGAKDVISKIWACWFPIMLFVLSGFEHSIATMYFRAVGLFAKDQYAGKTTEIFKVTTEKLDGLNWGTFWTGNLIPVTISNIIGGAIVIVFDLLVCLHQREPAQSSRINCHA